MSLRALSGTVETIPTTPAVGLTATPQQNEISEREGQTLAAITKCMLKDSNGTPEEVTAAETERQRVHNQHRLLENAGNLLEEYK